LVSPRGQRESAVLVAQFRQIIQDYPSRPAEGLTLKTFVPTVPAVQLLRSVQIVETHRVKKGTF
jgi:hypothetical protein